MTPLKENEAKNVNYYSKKYFCGVQHYATIAVD